MFAKLLLLVCSLAVLGASLLTLRQRRLDAIAGASASHASRLELERRRWHLETLLHAATAPDAIRRRLDGPPPETADPIDAPPAWRIPEDWSPVPAPLRRPPAAVVLADAERDVAVRPVAHRPPPPIVLDDEPAP